MRSKGRGDIEGPHTPQLSGISSWEEIMDGDRSNSRCSCDVARREKTRRPWKSGPADRPMGFLEWNPSMYLFAT